MPPFSRAARLMRTTLLVSLLFSGTAAAAEEVNLYTTREPGLIQPLLDAFSKESGVRVNTVFVRDGLLERVRAEGARSPADVLMTVDTGNLLDLVSGGQTQGIQSKVLVEAIPAHLRPYRYLLSPTLDTQPLDAAFLQEELQQRVQDLGSPAADLVEPLLPSDPTLETLRLAGSPLTSLDEVLERVAAGDADVAGVLRDAGRVLGDVVASCVALLNPRVVVVGGRLGMAGEALVAGVREAVYARVLPLASRELRVTAARSGSSGGVIGAALLAADAALSGDLLESRLRAA